MSVHIGELHTDVRTTGSSGDSPPDRGESARERAAEGQRRAEWLACRVAAEGFDD